MGSDVSAVKKILRQQLRDALEDLTEQERAYSDKELTTQFLQHPTVQAAQTLLLYYGVGTEIRTDAMIEALLSAGKTVCLPRCLPDYAMQAYAVHSLSDLEPADYAIPAPKTTCTAVSREEIDLVLVPGLCFDSRGSRLGQGGGYYDRYLEDYDGVTIGLCREDFFQINLPREPLDAWVSHVLTEEGQVWPTRPEAL